MGNQSESEARSTSREVLPAGTVTFLFTDIEGSTPRWVQHPAAMRVALARHDALLHAGIAAHGGVVLTERGEGDSIFALFARASDAVAAACALQRVLAAEPWPEAVAPIRVRMALHTGESGLHEGWDHRGAAVNRCARLRAIAHGGQVLLSGATYELVRDVLPPAASLRALGAHRLKGLTRPEQVYQLVHPDLPADFPPLKTLDVHRHNLPVQFTPFIGREREVTAVRERLLDPQTRLLTLTGPGARARPAWRCKLPPRCRRRSPMARSSSTWPLSTTRRWCCRRSPSRWRSRSPAAGLCARSCTPFCARSSCS